MLYYQVEWHLKGTCIWITSLFGIVINVILIIKQLRNPKKYSSATILTTMIAVSGIGMTVMEQSTFLNEAISPVTAPDWLWSLHKFTRTHYCPFLRTLFSYLIDFLMVSNCMNLYVLICRPQAKDLIMSKKMIAGGITCNLGLSALFSSLVTKLEHDAWNVPGLSRVGNDNIKYIWIPTVVLVLIISMITCSSCVFFTCKINLTLKKSIKFLQDSNATGNTIAAYKKIIKFSTIICAIFVGYNFLIRILEMSCFIIRYTEITGMNDLVSYSFDKTVHLMNTMNAMKYSINIIICFKPFCYGVAFMVL